MANWRLLNPGGNRYSVFKLQTWSPEYHVKGSRTSSTLTAHLRSVGRCYRNNKPSVQVLGRGTLTRPYYTPRRRSWAERRCNHFRPSDWGWEWVRQPTGWRGDDCCRV